MGARPREVSGELSPASVYVSFLPVVEACGVVAVPERVRKVRFPENRAYSCGVLMPQRR